MGQKAGKSRKTSVWLDVATDRLLDVCKQRYGIDSTTDTISAALAYFATAPEGAKVAVRDIQRPDQRLSTSIGIPLDEFTVNKGNRIENS